MSAPSRLEIARDAITMRPGRLHRWFGRTKPLRHTSREVMAIESRTMYNSSGFMLVLRENGSACLSGVMLSNKSHVRELLTAIGYELIVAAAPGWLWWFAPSRIYFAKSRGWL